MTVARILAIAGSDSGGGAGIQADIRTITLLGGHAMTAITAVTAQNTRGVDAVQVLPPAMVVAQIDAVVRDIGVDAVKIGMLGSAANAHAVADWFYSKFDGETMPPLVFDPVMIATSGAVLADAETVAAFERLMGLAALVTPNLPELAVLTGERDDLDWQLSCTQAIARRSGAAVLVKGGHADGAILRDRLVGGTGVTADWSDERIDTRSTHGTGCTLSSAIATRLGQGLDLAAAIGRGRDYVRAALRSAPGLGQGHGPIGPGVGLPPA